MEKIIKNSMTDWDMDLIMSLRDKIQILLDRNCQGMNAVYPMCALANVLGSIIVSVYNPEDYHEIIEMTVEILQGHLKSVSN